MSVISEQLQKRSNFEGKQSLGRNCGGLRKTGSVGGEAKKKLVKYRLMLIHLINCIKSFLIDITTMIFGISALRNVRVQKNSYL